MAIFFEKLYRGELNDAPHSIEMIQLLKRQNLNNIIPKYLPEGIEIAHKTGQIYSVAHDAGIIFSIKGDYIFVGMSDSNFYPDAEERIARVSESVYNYFQQTRDLEK
jgi:beta-lactamase class A